MGYPIQHIVGFDGQTYDIGGGGSNIWSGAWTDLNGSKYSNMTINNSDPLKIGDIVEVYNDNESKDTLSKRFVDVSSINSNINNKIAINMNGDSIASTGTSIGHLSPSRRWHFLVTNIDKESGYRTLVPINVPNGNSSASAINYNDTNIIEAASKVLAGYGCGTIVDNNTSARILPMDSKDNYVRPTEHYMIYDPNGRCTYIYYYANATNTITKLSNESTGGKVPSIPYLALAPYNGGHTYAPLYYDHQNSAALRGCTFGNYKDFTSKSYNWFIIETLN